MLYVVFGGLAIVASWWLVKAILGYKLPLEITARAYFVQLLKKQKIDQIVPVVLIDEFVVESIKLARSLGRLEQKNAAFIRAETVKLLELHSDMLRYWILGSDNFDGIGYKKEYRDKFEQHKIPRLGAR